MKKDALLSDNVWNWLLHRNNPEKESLFFQKLNQTEQSEFYDLRTDFLTESNDRLELIKKIAQLTITYNKLFQDHAFYLELLDSLHTPIFAKNHKLQFVFFNRAYEKAFGIQKNTLMGKTIQELEFLSDEHKAKYQNEDKHILDTLSQQKRTTQLRFTDGMKDSFYWTCGLNISSTNKRGIVGQIIDISKFNHMNEHKNEDDKEDTEVPKIEHLFRHDTLTELGNHIAMNDQLFELIHMSDRYGYSFCLCMIRLEDFETINNTFGRNIGDKILKDIAKLLNQLSRKIDIPTRYSGQCFIVSLPMTNLAKGRTMAERLYQMIQQEILLPDNSHISGTIGLVEYQAGESIENILTRLNEKMNHTTNKNRVVS